MKVADPLLPCRCCKGKGKTRLSGRLLETFNAIGQLGAPTIPEAHRKMGHEELDVTATNQLVRKLVKLKIVRKIKVQGKVSRYRQVNGAC